MSRIRADKLVNKNASGGPDLPLGATVSGILTSTGGFAGDGSNQILPSNAGSNRDNAIDLGTSNVRFQTLYATTSSINTSDKNEKQDKNTMSITCLASSSSDCFLCFSSYPLTYHFLFPWSDGHACIQMQESDLVLFQTCGK